MAKSDILNVDIILLFFAKVEGLYPFSVGLHRFVTKLTSGKSLRKHNYVFDYLYSQEFWEFISRQTRAGLQLLFVYAHWMYYLIDSYRVRWRRSVGSWSRRSQRELIAPSEAYIIVTIKVNVLIILNDKTKQSDKLRVRDSFRNPSTFDVN